MLPTWRFTIRSLVVAFAVGTLAFSAVPANAASFPAKAPKEWVASADWLRGALCIHRQEGPWDAATGNGYEGGMQFARATWVAVGGATVGSHWASVASKREQLFRAWLLWQAAGNSWRHWGGAAAGCGLT